MRTCAVQGCGDPISPRQIMCRYHWFLVPRLLRLEVMRTWLDCERGHIHAEKWRRYRDATAAAVAAVQGTGPGA